MGCVFCATARMAHRRSLETWEIVDQFVQARGSPARKDDGSPAPCSWGWASRSSITIVCSPRPTCSVAPTALGRGTCDHDQHGRPGRRDRPLHGGEPSGSGSRSAWVPLPTKRARSCRSRAALRCRAVMDAARRHAQASARSRHAGVRLHRRVNVDESDAAGASPI